MSFYIKIISHQMASSYSRPKRSYSNIKPLDSVTFTYLSKKSKPTKLA